ncbi:MAG: TlpA disulfide reductase family protein [Polyangiaceae bacterium]
MRALLVISLCLLPLVIACAPSGPPRSASSPILEKSLPAFQRPTVNGDKVSTKEGGRVTVVKFFAKYCEPCKKTLPEAQRLSQGHPDVLFVGVAEDEYQADVQEMITQFGLTFPVVHDRGNVLAGRFRVDELPITFVADAAGTIRWVGDGTTSESSLEAAIEWAKAPSTP